ncbi:long-subunit fatty acid transport protein [Amaricoccus macauensis]|uniref:Long-subunit fatty acid transport protein n=1 Tax=Amaricoccus macauensis TaxID=57001 RepID=A0A840SRJ3_9RHOB|nr:outer membrane protein transport protein [Amaricoccus macauensis]MBB5223390.1 long-subunit fatty acid transport protein [Amaricoccus macauensis]
MPRARVRALMARAARIAVPIAPAIASAISLAPAIAEAAAIERSVPSTSRILFETGRYGEFGTTWIAARQNGIGADLSPLGTPAVLDGRTGNMFDAMWSLDGALKADLGERLSFALILDQPYGARTTYPGGGTPVAAFYGGTLARLDTWEASGILAWDVTPSLKAYAGLRAQWLEARADIPFMAGYTVRGRGDWGMGYVAGLAFERPEIAFRAALTYGSAIRHRLATAESTALAHQSGTTAIDTPQAVTFEIQSGIAPRTLAFGSLRWVEWSDFSIDPMLYREMIGEPLVEYSGDGWTWTAGLAHQLTDALAGALSVTYEPTTGGKLTTLGPQDGRASATAALSYDFGAANLTGGVTWGRIGDTRNGLDTRFDDGSALGLGLRLGVSF